MGIYSIKPKFQQTLKPIERLLVKQKVHPTYINVAALATSLLGGYVLWQNIYLWFIPIMAFVRTALNALDGMVARKLKVKNQGYGEVLNEFFDRISDAGIFFGLALAPYTSLVLGSVTTIVVLLNSYLSIVSKAAGGKRQYGGVMGKADRMIYLGIMAVIILLTNNYVWGDYLLWFILAGTTITLAQRFNNIQGELRK